MAVNFILRVQEVDVPGGAHRLAQFLPQTDDIPVKVPQLLLGPDHPPAEHEHIVADGLNLQIVVPGGDALQLLPVPAVGQRPEQLPRLTGGAQDEPLPAGVDERLGHDGVALEVLQVGQGDQLVQVAQAGLVLGQHDQVLGLALGLSLSPEGCHVGVDFRQVMVTCRLQLFEKARQHIGHRGRVVAGPVVVEGGQTKVLRHNIQLVFAQLGQQVLSQN